MSSLILNELTLEITGLKDKEAELLKKRVEIKNTIRNKTVTDQSEYISLRYKKRKPNEESEEHLKEKEEEEKEEADIVNEKRKQPPLNENKDSIFNRVKKVKQDKVSSAVNIPVQKQPEEKTTQKVTKRERKMFGFLQRHLTSAKKIINKEEELFKQQATKEKLVKEKQKKEIEQSKKDDQVDIEQGKKELELISLQLQLLNKQQRTSLLEQNLMLQAQFNQTQHEPKIYWKLGKSKEIKAVDDNVQAVKTLHHEKCEKLKKELEVWLKDFKSNNPEYVDYVAQQRQQAKEQQNENNGSDNEDQKNSQKSRKNSQQLSQNNESPKHNESTDQQEEEKQNQDNIEQKDNTDKNQTEELK